ncbi:hypothetical protein ACIRTB_21215 [Streptomyces sp. NPDC101158]|uniref:hypothetical protein n=1 Tax=Streptomyces sp. NPDC101158 TaxID=3366117 RepID=UPI00382CE263
MLLAATGHNLMSGQDLPPSALVLAFAVSLAVAWTLARREHGLIAVTATTVAFQGTLHTVFSWYRQDGPTVVPGLSPGRTGAMAHASMEHVSMAHTVMGHAFPGNETLVHDMAGTSSSLGMLSVHLLAALLSGLWMAHGERAVFRLVRALRLWRFRSLRQLCLLLAHITPAHPQDPSLRLVDAGHERAPRRLLLADFVISRGPPPVAAVA